MIVRVIGLVQLVASIPKNFKVTRVVEVANLIYGLGLALWWVHVLVNVLGTRLVDVVMYFNVIGPCRQIMVNVLGTCLVDVEKYPNEIGPCRRTMVNVLAIGLLLHLHFIQVYVLTIGLLGQRIHMIQVHLALVLIRGITAVGVLEEEWKRSQLHGNRGEESAVPKLISQIFQAPRAHFSLEIGFTFVGR